MSREISGCVRTRSGFVYPRFMLSPMMGVMSDAFLDAVREMNLADFFLTAFVSVTGGSIPSSSTLKRRLAHWINAAGGAENFVPQILGRDAESVVSCAEKLLRMSGVPVCAVNLNAACPSPTVLRNGAGSMLLNNPAKLREMVESLRNALDSSVSLSVKIRAGFDDTALLEENVRACVDGGAELLIFHMRTAAEMYGPPPDDFEKRVSRVCAAAGAIPVIGNGSIENASDAQKFFSLGCAGVAVGRAFLKDPFLLRKLQFPGETFPPVRQGAEMFLATMKKFHVPPGPAREFMRGAFGTESITSKS